MYQNLSQLIKKLLKKPKRKIILASSSPRRKRLLTKLGIKFSSIQSKINEEFFINNLKCTNHKELAIILSFYKALSLLKRFKEDEIIIAFDTIVSCKNKIISKPKSKKDALRKILFLSNKLHKVITGIALIDLKKKKVMLDCETTNVKMKKITRQNALNYIKTKEPFGKAGAYAIQGKGGNLVKSIRGDYFNVVGLPVKKLVSMLKYLVN